MPDLKPISGREARNRSGVTYLTDLPSGYQDGRAEMLSAADVLYLVHPDMPSLKMLAGEDFWRDAVLNVRVSNA